MFIGLYCCLLVKVHPLSLAWVGLHDTESLWALFQGPIVKFRLGYPIFYLGTSKFSPQQWEMVETVLRMKRERPHYTETFLPTLQLAKCFIVLYFFIMNFVQSTFCLGTHGRRTLCDPYHLWQSFLCSLDGNFALIQWNYFYSPFKL